MFRRPLPAGNQSALGNKDRKRLREALLRSFPLLTEHEAELLVPAREAMIVARINLPQATQTEGGPQQPGALPPLMSASSSNKCSLFIVDELPLIAEVNGLLFPTVHGLWRAPTMLPCIIVFSQVSCFVLKGADLMLPGVCRPLTAAAARAAGIESMAPGQLWAVRVAGNSLPFAVGRAAARAPSLDLLPEKGRALELMHHLGDSLWKHGKHVQLPPLFTLQQVYSGADDADLLASCGMGPPEGLPGGGHPQGQGEKEALQEGPQTAEGGETDDEEAPALVTEGNSGTSQQAIGSPPLSGDEALSKPTMTPEEMGAYLELCLLQALHSLSDEQLPLDVSALYSKITAEAPAVFFTKIAGEDAPFVSPDVRRSSVKKLAKFVQGASKKKLFQSKEQRGVVSVVKINRTHPAYLKFAPIPEAQKKKLIEKTAAAAAAAAAGSAAGAAGVDGSARETAGSAGAGRSVSGPLVFEFCVPPAKCGRVFAGAGVRIGKNIYFTSQEYRDVLIKYLEARDVKREDGQNIQGGGPPPTPPPRGRDSAVALDPVLAEAVLTKEERGEAKAAGTEAPMMEKAQLFLRWQDTQQPCHAVLRDEKELPLLQERIVKGACLPVRITVEEKMGGRKHATHILNAGNFLLEPKAIAEFLQKKLAASASVYAPPGSKATSAVCVQGNVAGAVAELMISHFGVPKKYLEIETKKPRSAR